MEKAIEAEIRSLYGAPKFDRRAFVVTSLGAGFALAAMPLSAQTMITTSTEGLTAGEVKVPAPGGFERTLRAVPVFRRRRGLRLRIAAHPLPPPRSRH